MAIAVLAEEGDRKSSACQRGMVCIGELSGKKLAHLQGRPIPPREHPTLAKVLNQEELREPLR
jgi:hypothetical protein